MHMGKAHTIILLYTIRRSTNELGFHKCILLSHHSPLCLGLYAQTVSVIVGRGLAPAASLKSRQHGYGLA